MSELEGLWRLAIILGMQMVVMVWGVFRLGHTLDKILQKLEAEG